MHVQIVSFHLKGMTEHEFRAMSDELAPTFATVPGLISKTWLADADTNTYGGVYLWDNMEAAKAFYSGPWVEGIRARYGMDPVIRYFETSAITDNKPVTPAIRRFNAARVGAAAES